MALINVENIIPSINNELGATKKKLRKIAEPIIKGSTVIKKIGRVEVQFCEGIKRDLAQWAVTGEFEDKSYYVSLLYMVHLNNLVRVDPDTGLVNLTYAVMERKVELAFHFIVNARLDEYGQVVLTATIDCATHGFSSGDDEVNDMLVQHGTDICSEFAKRLADKRIVFASRDELVTI